MKKMLGLAVICFLSLNLMSAEDEGYFLSFSQKGQLIWRGEIKGDDGSWYNIRMVPGYVAPSRNALENWGDATDSFGEYFEARKYKDLSRNSSDAYEWAFDDCINKFIIKGVPDSWSEYFGAANNKVEKRIFGWPMAYPVAVFQTFVDNVFRGVAGTTGCVFGATAGTVIVPGYHMINSGTKGVYYFVGPGMILPMSAYTWNTIISPPLALTGQKPSEERIDGYWVTKISPDEYQAENNKLDGDDIDAIAVWGKILYDNLWKYEDERVKNQKILADKLQALNEEISKKKQELIDDSSKTSKDSYKAEQDGHKRLLNSPENNEIICKLGEMGLSNYTVEVNYYKLTRALAGKNMSEEQARTAYELLKRYSNIKPVAGKPSSNKKDSAEKTDPVKETIQVLKNTDK